MNAAGGHNNLQPRGPFEDLQAWFMSIPFATRYLFASSFGLSVAAGAGLISPKLLYLAWPLVYKKFEVWRLLTSFLWYPLQYGYLMLLYFLYNYSWQLETSPQFSGRKADYVFFILFSMVIILPLGVYMSQFVLLESLVLSMLYVWSMNNKETEVSFFFGLRFKAMYLPWVYCIFDFLTGAPFPPVPKLIGIFAGHIYYFLDTIYPENNNGARLLHTPGFLYQLFGEDLNARGMGGVGGTSAAPQGRGHRLGGEGGGAGSGWSFTRPRETATGAPGGSGSGSGSDPNAAGVRQRSGYSWGASGQRLGAE
ncbi:Der1-like family-domain-containing protein [Chytriomyces sp. MP71]|nr:Der1-like family-domain-containing protein [Chytriomyces sp. MP71]